MTAPAPEAPEVAAEPQTGAALLLLPTPAEQARLALPDGELADALHLTLWYGGDAAGYPEAQRASIAAALADLPGLLPLEGDAMGAAVLNPADGPATVLLVQSDGLTALRDTVVEALTGLTVGPDATDPMAAEHPSWLPHVTLAYADRVADAEALIGPIAFDRVVLNWGPDTTELAAPPVASALPIPDPVAGFLAQTPQEMPDVDTAEIVTDPEDAAAAGPLPERWEGVLAPLGVPSGDQRMFSPDGGDVRPGGLALRWQDEAWPGHDGCVVVGLIETAEIRPLTDVEAPDFFLPAGTPVIWGSGPIDLASEEGADFARRLRDGYAPWVSVDIDDYESELRDENGQPLPEPGPDEMLLDLPPGAVEYAVTWRLMAVTAVATPAFAEARIRPVAPVAVPEQAPEPVVPEPTVAAAPPVPPVDEPAEPPILPAVDDQVAWSDPDGTEHQGLVVAVDDAAGTVDVEEDLGGGDSQVVTLPAEQVTVLPAPEAGLAASAAPEVPPGEWFDDPQLDQLTPLTITADGRVYGHLAAWGTCHTGFPNACVTPPPSSSGYAYFTVGETMTAAGPRPTGVLSVGAGHAKTVGLSFRDAIEHYDRTGTAVADVAAGEDAHGIWVAGALRPGASASKVTELRRSGLSGDWRRIGGALELVAGLAVNAPGFPVPRSPRMAVAGGRQTALVAAGAVLQPDTAPDDPARASLVAAAVAEMEARQSRRSRAARLARRVGRDRQSKVAALAARVNR